jgi:hypothetical protein
MHVSYLIERPEKRKGTSLMLVKVKGNIEDRDCALEWSEKLMSTIYDGEAHLMTLLALLMATARLWHPAHSPP